MFFTGRFTGTSLIALARGTNTWLSTGMVQQMILPPPGLRAGGTNDREHHRSHSRPGPDTRAVVITQFPRGVCDVHAPEMSLPSRVQLGGGGPV